VSTGGPSKSNGNEICALFPKSSDSSDLGKSVGTLELTVSFLGEENQMGCPAWSGAYCTWAKNTPTNTTAAKNRRALQMGRAEIHLELSGYSI